MTSLAHLGALVLGFIPWLLWSVAALITPSALNGKRNGRRRIDAEAQESFFGRSRRRLHPVQVSGVANGCKALHWTRETIRSFPETVQLVYTPWDKAARCIFLINSEWASRVQWEENVDWTVAVDRILAPRDENTVARFQLVPGKGSRFQTDTPQQPTGWSRTFWFQSRRAVTPFHYDTRHAAVTQLHGRKRFLLASPFFGFARLSPFHNK